MASSSTPIYPTAFHLFVNSNIQHLQRLLNGWNRKRTTHWVWGNNELGTSGPSPPTPLTSLVALRHPWNLQGFSEHRLKASHQALNSITARIKFTWFITAILVHAIGLLWNQSGFPPDKLNQTLHQKQLSHKVKCICGKQETMWNCFQSHGVPEQREAGTFISDGEWIFKKERWAFACAGSVGKHASTYTEVMIIRPKLLLERS